ncbi:MAG: type IV pilus secretin PilQ, partial [Pseudomonadales bacterium]|nr:type IV pilus secretin PilQ [Pseudomonadales bacterium]
DLAVEDAGSAQRRVLAGTGPFGGIEELGGNILIKFSGAQLPAQLQRTLDVTDFATPVVSLDALVEDGQPVIRVKPKGEYQYLAYQVNNIFTLTVKPVIGEEVSNRRLGLLVYVGEKLSLNFQDIEVRSVLQLIADFTDLNLVASDTVSGRITLRLKNTPWDQALDLILKTKGLDKRQDGNVLMVAPASEIAAREKLELQTSKQLKALAPLYTEYVDVRYAKAEEVIKLLGGKNGVLSNRGSVVVDSRTNILIIRDVAQSLAEVHDLLKVLDVPVRQVSIEARIVIANASYGKELGIKWGGSYTKTKNSGDTYTAGGKDINDMIVDLGVNKLAQTTFRLGFTGAAATLSAELSALEESGNGEVVSQPKLMTADRQKARISSGTEIPYQEASSSGATSTSFKEAVLSLDVTPQITPDGRIIMDLVVNQDSVGELTSEGIPTIDTNEITTQVLVNNGETVVLGGVFRTEDVESVVKTPFLGDIPYVGAFFRKTSVATAKTELLIFITPRLVEEK